MPSMKWILLLSVIAAIVGLSVQGCAPAAPELLVEVTADPATGTVPVTTVATATVSGGTAPYIYLWTSAPGGVIAKPLQSSTNILFAVTGTYTVTCTVTDSAGQIKSASATVTVTPVGDPVAGAALFAAQCIGCHPSAAALKPQASQITNNMGSIDPAMSSITLTDQQVADLKAYLNSL
jgi:hypothetical protein